MAKTTKKAAASKGNETGESLIINNLTISTFNRKEENISTWQTALKSAENVANPRRKLLYELYRNISTDGFLKSLVDKRLRAVLTTPIILEGVDNDELLSKFKTPWFSQMLKYIMESKFYGHSLIELIMVDGEIGDVELIPRVHVVPEKGVIQKTVGSEGDVIDYNSEPESNYLLSVGQKTDLGLFNNLAPYVLYKRGNLADNAQFNELFGQPIREYVYDPHVPSSRIEAENAAKNAGAAAYIVVPKGTELKLHQSSGISASGAFKDLTKTLNDEMAITVLGQTLTTSNDGVGSNALGKVHKDVEEAINLEDKQFVEYVLNWDFKWVLMQHGYPLEQATFRFDDTQRMSTKDKADMFIALNAQFPIDPQFVYKELNIDAPDETVIKEWRANRSAAPQPGGAAAGK